MILSSLGTVAVRGAAAGAAFAMHLVVARLLGAADTGLFFYALAIGRGVVDFGRFGLNQSIVRFVAPALHEGDRRGAAIYARTGGALVAALTTALTAAAAAACLWLAPVLAPERAALWDLLAGFVWVSPVLALLVYASGVLLAQGRPQSAALMEVALVPGLVCLGLLALAPALGGATVGLAAGVYALACVLALAAAGLLLGRGAVRGARPRRREAAELLHASHPLLVVNMMNYVIQFAPLLILGAVAAFDEVGVFTVAHRVSMVLSILLTAVAAVMQPRFAVAHRAGAPERLQRDFDDATLLLLAAGLPAAAVLGLFGREILSLLGPEFGEGALMLRLLLLGQLVNIATACTSTMLAMTGREAALRRTMVASALLCLVLSAALIPLFGGLGAAVAISITTAVQSLHAAVLVRRLVGVRVLSSALPARLAALASRRSR